MRRTLFHGAASYVGQILSGAETLIGSRAAMTAAWACVIAVTWLSLAPQHLELRTSLPGGFEHALAYFGTAALLRIGYPNVGRLRIALCLAIYAAVLESLQTIVPGRHGAVLDAAISGFGALIGDTIAAAWIRWRARVVGFEPTCN
jgi:VanZ family protein